MTDERTNPTARENPTASRRAEDGSRDPLPLPPQDLTVADDAAEIEALLGRLPLVRPGATTDRRVLAAIERHLPVAAWPLRLRPALLVAAAAVAVTAGVAPLLLRPADRSTNRATGEPAKVLLLPQGGVPMHPDRDGGRTPDRSGDEPGQRTGDLPAGASAVYPVHLPQSDPGDAPAVVPDEPVAGPISVERTFERVRDDGVVLVEGGTAYTRLRRQSVRRIVVVDPATGRQVVVTVPMTEVRVRPVQPF